MSIRQIIKTAISRLTQLAQDMAEPFKKVPIWMDHAKCLDNIFVELDEFALSIAQEIKSLRFYGPNLLDMDSSSNTGHRISKTVDAESLQAVRHGIIALLNAKRYGRAYIAQLDLITRYPEYVTDGDLLQLEQSKTSFLSEPSLFQVMEEHAPETLKSVSLFLPLLSREILQRRPFKTLLVLSDKIRKHDFSGTKGQDCLGRSSYHVLADAGIQRRWHVLRINHQDILGRTALYFACRDGDERRITGLISSGANILLQTVTGLTPLHIAAAMGYNSACRLLWDAYGGGPLQHVVIYRDCTGCTPLLCAASTGRHETVRFFCEQVHMNSPLDYTDQHGNSALGLAVRAGNVTTVRLLMTYVVERRMSPDFADVKGRTPFWHAVAGSHYEMMQVMVDLVDPDRRDDDGRTPLAEAARTGDTIAVKFLLDLNSFIRVRVDQNCRDKAGKSVLILAAEAGQTQCAKLLLDPPFCGVYDKDVRTAVELAERSSNYELLEVLERVSFAFVQPTVSMTNRCSGGIKPAQSPRGH